MCEIQSSPENLHDANAHTAEVAISQLTTKGLQGVVAITMGKNRSAMIFAARAVGTTHNSYYQVSFKPVTLEWHDLMHKEGLQRFSQVYYSTLKSLPQVTWTWMNILHCFCLWLYLISPLCYSWTLTSCPISDRLRLFTVWELVLQFLRCPTNFGLGMKLGMYQALLVLSPDPPKSVWWHFMSHGVGHLGTI